MYHLIPKLISQICIKLTLPSVFGLDNLMSVKSHALVINFQY